MTAKLHCPVCDFEVVEGSGGFAEADARLLAHMNAEHPAPKKRKALGSCRECGDLLKSQKDVNYHADLHQSGTDTILGPEKPAPAVEPTDVGFFDAPTDPVDLNVNPNPATVEIIPPPDLPPVEPMPAEPTVIAIEDVTVTRKGMTVTTKRVNVKPKAAGIIAGARRVVENLPPNPKVDAKIAALVIHDTREAWMLAAVETFRPWFAEAGYPVGPVRVSVGFPGGRGSSKAVGQCWMPEAVADAVPAIFVSPVQHDPLEVLETILHEMVHAGGASNHDARFGKAARPVGLTAPWRKHPMTDELKARLEPVAKALGPFGHAEIKTGVDRLGGGRKVQSTRMLKVMCPEDGYTVRTTRQWLRVGLPSCPDGHEMEEVTK